jgi:HAD superfamily hydrolase (TIGR01509 family)
LIKGVIFDLDGLMINSEPLALQAWQLSLSPFGAKLTPMQYKHLIGHSRRVALDYIIEQTGISLSGEELNELFTSNMLSLIDSDQLQLMPGLLPLLDELAERKYPLGIASNSPAHYVRMVVARTGIAARFACVVSAEEVAHSKPAPDVYLEAARRLGIGPAHCLAFEDSPSGVRAAQAAGMHCVFIPNPDIDPVKLDGEVEVFPSLSDCHASLDEVLQRACLAGDR